MSQFRLQRIHTPRHTNLICAFTYSAVVFQKHSLDNNIYDTTKIESKTKHHKIIKNITCDGHYWRQLNVDFHCYQQW